MAETIDRYGGLVWHLARKALHDHADQEDAVQEVFVQLWKSAPTFDASIASEVAFVAMIARRRIIDRARHQRTRIRSAINTGDLSGSIGDRPSTATVSAALETCEEAELAASAMAQLTPAQQQILRMSIHDGLSHQEISDRLGAPLGTVKTNLRRGLMAVRAMLAERGLPSPFGAAGAAKVPRGHT
jgi:RNA polymerase sigma-70 factor (ECF subfamily)